MGPADFKRLLVDRKLYLGERDILMKKCDQKTDREIDNMRFGNYYQNPKSPVNGEPTIREYSRNNGRYTLVLHFTYNDSFNVYRVTKVELKRN